MAGKRKSKAGRPKTRDPNLRQQHVYLPEAYAEAMRASAAAERRTLTVEYQLAVEAYLLARGLLPPKES